MSLVTQLIVAIILGGHLSRVAEPQELLPRAATGPKIQFASTEYDFGKVEESVVVKHDFVFTNIGVATLEISDVRPGCGCTAGGKWDKKVKPGKTGIIPLEFNSANFSGTVSKQATVISNDPGHSNVVLEIKGTVWKPIDVSASTAIPPQIMLLAGTLSNAVHEVVTVRYTGTNAFSLSDATVNAPGVAVRMKETDPGRSFDLTVDFPAGFQVEAGQKVELTVKSSHPRFQHVKVPVFVPQPPPDSALGPD